MGVEVTYQKLSPEKFHSVTANQTVWQEFRGTGLPGFSLEEIMAMAANPTPESNAKFMAALQNKNQDPSRLEVSKDWHVLYYLLTGSAEIAEEHQDGKPLHNVIFGGRTLPVTTGYGPVRYFDHAQIGEIFTALSSVSMVELNNRFNPEEMRRLDVYAPPDERDREIIFGLINHLKAFFQDAMQAKDYIIVYGH